MNKLSAATKLFLQWFRSLCKGKVWEKSSGIGDVKGEKWEKQAARRPQTHFIKQIAAGSIKDEQQARSNATELVKGNPNMSSDAWLNFRGLEKCKAKVHTKERKLIQEFSEILFSPPFVALSFAFTTLHLHPTFTATLNWGGQKQINIRTYSQRFIWFTYFSIARYAWNRHSRRKKKCCTDDEWK